LSKRNEKLASEKSEIDNNSSLKAISLKIVCSLSIIAGGFWIFILLTSLFGYEIHRIPVLYSDRHNYGSIHLISLIILHLLSVSGAFIMWLLNKKGFYLYFIAQFLLFNYPLLFAGSESFDLNELFFTTLFILFYGINLGIMKK
jgi:hypothetical protein